MTNVATVRGKHGSLHEEAADRRGDIVAFLLEWNPATSEQLRARLPWFDGLSDHCYVVWAALACVLVLGTYFTLLVSAGCLVRLTGGPWAWLAPTGVLWWVAALRLLGALVCLLLVVAFFFTARESLLFVLVVALLAGWALNLLFAAPLGPPVALRRADRAPQGGGPVGGLLGG